MSGEDLTGRSAARTRVALVVTIVLGILACAADRGARRERHGWMGERGIVVPHESFPADCTLCHTGDDWNTLRADFAFDHLAETGVALQGAHAQAQCLRCHNDRGPVALYAGRGCGGCHADVHQGTLGPRCTDCHGEDVWIASPEVASHQRTRFPLVGAHVAAACWSCHPGSEVGNFQRVDVKCITCHAGDLATATDPDHQAQGWVDDCQRCHVPTSWTGAGFSHAAWPLTGAHAIADCGACHTGGDFTGVPTTCVACHQADYDGTQDPDHAAGEFPTSCELCHDTSSWEGAMFSHAGISGGCAECHLDDYQQTDDPDHAVFGWPTTCELCHQPAGWDDASFDHSGVTMGCVQCHLVDYQRTDDPDHVEEGFPMTCEQCHTTGSWEGGFDHAGITMGCVECHLDDYQQTGDPDHGLSGFPTACELCHAPDGWDGGSFDHAGVRAGCAQCHLLDYQGTTDPNHARSGFPTTCEQCHDTGTWEGAGFDHRGIRAGCVECHLDEYQQTRDPNHMASGWPTTCEQCHQTTGWRGASFDHAGVRSGCVQCHLSDYQGTNDPNHASAGFPTSCELCHGTRGWQPADFDHDFPIEGRDHGQLDCADCHPNPRAFRVFTCTDCHAHNQRDMDDEHDRVGGYIYLSSACYACHPNGQQR